MQAPRSAGRRHALRFAAIAVAAGSTAARAQASTRIDRLDTALDAIVASDESIRLLVSGLGNEQGTAEGPVWWKESGRLVFTAIGNDRILEYSPGRGTSVLRESANRSNGLTRDLQGRLVACEQESRRVVRQEEEGAIVVVAERYRGLRLNRQIGRASCRERV